MDVGCGPITRDRFERGPANRTNPLLSSFAQDAHRFGIKININHVEGGEFAQAQPTAVKQLHDRGVAERHPFRRGAFLVDLERRGQ